MATKNKAIGIDLGTCYSCVAVYHNERVQIIANDEGNKTTPSMVAFTSRERLIGDAAKNQFTLNTQNTIFDTKRLIGRCFSDDSVQRDMALWPFQVVCGKNNKPSIEVEYRGSKRKFSAEEISSMVLFKMKEIAEAYLNCEVTNAVITVPVYFNDAQRQATINAATIAGLHAMQVINEPTATAIAYGLDAKTYTYSEGKNLLVFDLGGGTLDISLLSIKKSVFQVLAVHGDTHLGGEDFDNNFVEYCAKQFEVKSTKNITENARALHRLRSACERAKRSLSSALETSIEIDCLCDGIDFSTKITRTKFELLNEELFDRCMKGVEKCLADANMKKKNVDKVVLVGGSARIPKIREMMQELFGQKVLCNSINPDEAVAYGAAVQAAVLSGNRIDLRVIDVTPLSLGVKVKGDVFVVIPKNTPIPTRKEEYFKTTQDDQTSVTICVFQGERVKIEDNKFLDYFTLTGFPAAPAGEVGIKICFDIDGSGTLKVSAEHKTTGLKNEISISSEDLGGLSKHEMERMLVDAERFRLEDKQLKENASARRALENYCLKMRERVRKQKLQGKMEMKEIEDIDKGVKEATEWVDMSDENTETQQFEEKLQELKITCNVLTPTSPKSLTVTSPHIPDQRDKTPTKSELK